MLKQVFRIILNQQKSNFWIIMELIFVSVCLWYIIDYMGGLCIRLRIHLWGGLT